MNKTKQNRWWRYSIVSLIGIFLFSIFIPSCTYLSSANFDVLVRDKKPEAIADQKSLAEILANLPTAEQIQAMPLAAHPRLLASAARFAEIRQQIQKDEVMQQWYQELKWKANYYVRDTELPKYTIDGAAQLLPVSRRLVERISVLGLVYLISGEPQYLNKTWQELEAVVQFRDWNPTHFLDTAEMTYGVALAYDWLYDSWNQTQKSLLRQAIIEKGLKPALVGYSLAERWTEVENNWNQVCNSGIGLGALSILSEKPAIASQALAMALSKLPLAMQHYAPDGGWSEGIHYWHYGTLHNTLLLAALNTSMGKDFDLSLMTGFAETGFFPIYLTNQSGLPFNFADSKYRPIDAPEMFWLSRRFEQPAFAQYARQRKDPSAMDLIWYHPEVEAENFSSLALDRYFQSVEVVSLRSDWQDKEGIFFAFKAGDNQAYHGNLDLGTFVLDAMGIRWAVDLGGDDYSLPGYFDRAKQRWDYYRMRTEGQNTLVINPDRDPDQNINATAEIVRTKFTPEHAYAIADLTPAYTPEVNQVTRGIALKNQRQQALIQDEIKTEQAIDVYWFMHTNADINIAPDRKSVLLSQDGKQLAAQILGTGECYFSQMFAEPLATSPTPTRQAKNNSLKKLTIELNSVTNSQIAVLFTPVDNNQPISLSNRTTKIKSIKRW